MAGRPQDGARGLSDPKPGSALAREFASGGCLTIVFHDKTCPERHYAARRPPARERKVFGEPTQVLAGF
jgi:hypothetical protein